MIWTMSTSFSLPFKAVERDCAGWISVAKVLISFSVTSSLVSSTFSVKRGVLGYKNMNG